eukprot:1142268-Pelagomonas_calceolata.AAC.3
MKLVMTHAIVHLEEWFTFQAAFTELLVTHGMVHLEIGSNTLIRTHGEVDLREASYLAASMKLVVMLRTAS